MILDTSLSIALKDELGRYNIGNINLFKIEEANNIFKLMKIKLKNKNTVMVSLKCPLCEKWHSFNYCINDMINQELIVCGCKTLGTPVLFIGENDRVSDRVKQYNRVIKETYAIF
ncbi:MULTISPECIES: hypothetical protein [Clostridium]|uniref:hypothetical protein n=1 Tax=Clostridium TaxID=1485 RepID=UPI00069DDBE9|nr:MULTISPECIES: hypothetical protein [Clostridium]KOF56659.1 hypothetical protein AGR56_07990 [Clostridium sp. DMHC 10]MCD2346722.1 hypothetical protein [Clostridium guangxiense]